MTNISESYHKKSQTKILIKFVNVINMRRLMIVSCVLSVFILLLLYLHTAKIITGVEGSTATKLLLNFSIV